MFKHSPFVLLLLGAAACAPRMDPVRPIYRNGQVVPSRADEVVADARAEGQAERDRIAQESDRNAQAALASCSGAVCDAITRGELAVGMTREQVLAATRSSLAAWDVRGGGRVTTLAARDGVNPSDVVAPVAMVTLEDGMVRSYAYREPQGLRLVASRADASSEGVARARAAALLREGDEMALAGRFEEALDRYDRADLVDPENPETTLKIARALDKALRPYEAQIRYQLFLHQMELERIRAHGEAYAHLSGAMIEARQRIIVLERGR
ncbi:hypothetical protein [Longimicrobium sp.]|jgi:tetratricopeptide (TPR) repeat protein|uniref:hypothetical protein n=1 Tax=Longimicrobium sp. TaxID=2029185 RepID=UPI002ED77EC9